MSDAAVLYIYFGDREPLSSSLGSLEGAKGASEVKEQLYLLARETFLYPGLQRRKGSAATISKRRVTSGCCDNVPCTSMLPPLLVSLVLAA